MNKIVLIFNKTYFYSFNVNRVFLSFLNQFEEVLFHKYLKLYSNPVYIIFYMFVISYQWFSMKIGSLILYYNSYLKFIWNKSKLYILNLYLELFRFFGKMIYAYYVLFYFSFWFKWYILDFIKKCDYDLFSLIWTYDKNNFR